MQGTLHLWLKGKGPALGMMPHAVFEQDEGSHCLDDWNRPGQYAGIMTAPPDQLGVSSLLVDGILGFENGCGGFEPDPKVEFLAIRNAALDASGQIGFGTDLSIPVLKRVVMLRTLEESTLEATAYLEALGCRKGEHGFGHVRFQSIENG